MYNAMDLILLGSSPSGATLLDSEVGRHRVGGEAGGEGAEGGRWRGQGGQFRIRRTQGETGKQDLDSTSAISGGSWHGPLPRRREEGFPLEEGSQGGASGGQGRI